MDLFDNLALGFATALTWQNVGYALLGCLIGTFIGLLPGLGPISTVAMLLPITYSLPPAGALILLASIYYGAQYGGSTTAILLKLPGESSSAVTMIDGHAMARQGRAGVALATAAIGSFIAGSFGVLLLATVAEPLTEVAFLFGPAEYFSLMVLGLVGSIALSSDTIDKSLGLMVLGLLFSLVGTDINSGEYRFTGQISDLYDGIELTALAMGVFGVAEIAINLEQYNRERNRNATLANVTQLIPGKKDIRRMLPAIARGTAIGSLLGALPGAGVTMASFAGYALEKKASRYKDELGQGAIEGVAGPESANNAAAQTNFISLLTLGIPGSAIMALLLGAMIIQDIQPGPQVISNHPAVFWGLIASMWIGNLMLVVLNLPMVGIWVKMLRVPYRILFPVILVFCSVGAFTVRASVFDIYLLGAFGILGYVLIKLSVSPVPLLMGMVLGPMLENSFRRALMVSQGDLSIIYSRPLSLGLLIAAGLLIVISAYPSVVKKRKTVLAEEAI
ncbi:MAG: tripartite tricarboxylate transporter permease [Alcaligenaceae bacterium]|nr:tripartite tricarboxylate transporter permease [Alcaligenaceae bacterium SAGV5]MPS52578.1 tripartite tricarboxylate transporter permease [Alcaligenaceae bacterium SAGV3]MPT60339.1 tripartite tricarboxylate transporter permease [Alcaligenaceae bacterium]